MNKFNLLFEEIMQSIISVDTFKFKFKEEENGNISCSFDVLNDDNKLIKVNAFIKKTSNEITFDLIDEDVTNTLNEKSFMMKYYNDYKKFKDAYKKFKAELNNNEKSEAKDEVTSFKVNGREIPVIKKFNSKLNIINKKIQGKIIKVLNNSFIFRLVDDDIKNLIQVDFDLINEEPKKDELPKYSILSIVKLRKNNSVPVKFILRNPGDLKDKQELSAADFKNRFPNYYKNFSTALTQYQKTQD